MRRRQLERLLLLVVCSSALAAGGLLPAAGRSPAPAPEQRRGATNHPTGTVPLAFEPNLGQASSNIDFIARTPGSTTRLTSRGLQTLLPAGRTFRMRLVASNKSAELVPSDATGGKVNYLVGARRDWVTGIRTYGTVSARQVYPGVDAVYRGIRSGIEYDFHVAPGVNPDLIRMRFPSSDAVSIGPDGDLVVSAPGGELRQPAPFIYQSSGGHKVEVSGGYALFGNEVGFWTGNYDHSRRLVIDPTLSFSTYLGGADQDRGLGIDVDDGGNVYVSGHTYSSDFPVAGGLQPTFNGGPYDAFVSKVAPDGSHLVYSTYLGGSSVEEAPQIVATARGAVIAGRTSSRNFPIVNAVQPQLRGREDAYVARLTGDGSALAFSTFLGGSALDKAADVAVGTGGAIYVAGETNSQNLPGSPIQPGFGGGYRDAFVAKLGYDGRFKFMTYLGGSAVDRPRGIAVDQNGIYVTGWTNSLDFPIKDAVQPIKAGPETSPDFSSMDAFQASIDLTGRTLRWATYFGGSSGDAGFDNVIGADGTVYMGGRTESDDFPVRNAYQPVFGGDPQGDGMLVAFTPDGQSTPFSTYFGGSGFDRIFALDVGTDGAITAAGRTNSRNLPVFDAYQPSFGGGYADGFLTRFNSGGSSLVFSTYLGGRDYERALGVTVDGPGNTYATGQVNSLDYPVTAGAFQTNFAGGTDAFVTKLSCDC